MEDVLAYLLSRGLCNCSTKGDVETGEWGEDKGRGVIRAQQEGSGIESNLGHGIGPLLPPSTLQKEPFTGPVDILFALTGCPHDSYVYTPKWHHCRSSPSEQKNDLIDRNSQFPSRLL